MTATKIDVSGFLSARNDFARDLYFSDSEEPMTAAWLLDVGATQDTHTINLSPTCKTGYFAYEVRGMNTKRGWQDASGWRIFREDDEGEEHEICEIPTRLAFRLANRLLGLGFDTGVYV